MTLLPEVTEASVHAKLKDKQNINNKAISSPFLI
jgi:hypothetical protein